MARRREPLQAILHFFKKNFKGWAEHIPTLQSHTKSAKKNYINMYRNINVVAHEVNHHARKTEQVRKWCSSVALLASLSSIPTTAVDTIQTTVSAENEMTCCHDVFGKHLTLGKRKWG
jgi:hypothetical protein